MPSRTFTIAANWKMHKSPRETSEYLRQFLHRQNEIPQSRRVVFFVPTIDLLMARECLQGSRFDWGAQNCHFEMQGAFTGETSPLVLAELNTPMVLVGHSERRSLFAETDSDVAKKVEALQKLKIEPMICVGETLEQRDRGETQKVIAEQLNQALSRRVPAAPLTLAYEPVWAIGTGRVATPDQVNEAHAGLRSRLAQLIGGDAAERTSILYGGSVKPENAKALASLPDVDGFLVGGASLQVESFLSLCLV